MGKRLHICAVRSTFAPWDDRDARPLARFDRNIDVHLSSIRQKIAALGSDKSCIQTVYRLGYQFIKE